MLAAYIYIYTWFFATYYLVIVSFILLTNHNEVQYLDYPLADFQLLTISHSICLCHHMAPLLFIMSKISLLQTKLCTSYSFLQVPIVLLLSDHEFELFISYFSECAKKKINNWAFGLIRILWMAGMVYFKLQMHLVSPYMQAHILGKFGLVHIKDHRAMNGSKSVHCFKINVACASPHFLGPHDTILCLKCSAMNL